MKVLEQLFFRRPRILNVLHQLRLVRATSQTNSRELETLRKYASGAHLAVEIGTYQGVSAAVIASVLDPHGILFCIDPWPDSNARPNPSWHICQRHLRRQKVTHRINILRAASRDVRNKIPDVIDFVFIDGDHSWEGIKTDWEIVSPRIARGGVVCLHDSFVPPAEPWKHLPSVDFFHTVIGLDQQFRIVGQVDSMAVLRKE